MQSWMQVHVYLEMESGILNVIFRNSSENAEIDHRNPREAVAQPPRFLFSLLLSSFDTSAIDRH
jgi:hypothetical protein